MVLRLVGHEKGGGLFARADIQDHQLHRMANLLRREANTISHVHCLHHVGGKLPDLGCDAVNPSAFFAEHGVPEFDDFQNHCCSI